jgi:hypothetical protein
MFLSHIDAAMIPRNLLSVLTMKFTQLHALLGTLTLTIATAVPAQAAPWTYGIDSFNDGITGGVAGDNGAFEFFGMAVAEEGDQVFVALNANLLLTGYNSDGAVDGHIGWGDLFLNFSGQNYDTAFANGDMFALHISGTDSDSSAQANGLYKVDSAQNVAPNNSGFTTLQDRKNHVDSYGQTEGVGNFDYTSYFNLAASNKNVMSSGTKLGDIAFLDSAALSAKGLNFGAYNATGSQTFGFSFSKTDLNLPEEFQGNPLIASIFAECNNDGMGVKADIDVTIAEIEPETPESVPEPASVLGILAIAGSAISLRRRHA